MMNYGRVILGGLVAGLVLNVGEFVLNGVLLSKQMADWFAAHNLPTDAGPMFLAVATLLTFAMGITIVWLYALIRPRSGPGPKTAACAGLFMWFGVYVYMGIIMGMLLVQPASIIAIGTVYGLAEYVIAAIAGAWLYKEA
jgi:hypothetical protein